MSIPKSILAAAMACFANHPDEVEVHVTEDGNAWLGAHKNLAQAHASLEKLPAPVTVSRADVGLEDVQEQEQEQEKDQEQEQEKEQEQEQANADDEHAAGEEAEPVSPKGKKGKKG
jgi:hypothetical protein